MQYIYYKNCTHVYFYVNNKGTAKKHYENRLFLHDDLVYTYGVYVYVFIYFVEFVGFYFLIHNVSRSVNHVP